MQTMYRMLAVILFAMTVAGCHSSTSAPQAPTFELKAYQVPAAESRVIAQHLDAILASPGFLVGTDAHTAMRATQPFPGTVMVLAPAAVQPSIANAIAELAKASGKQSEAAPQAMPLRLEFWIVQAKAGSGDDSASLQPLAPTLEHIRQKLGSSHFVLEDSAAVAVDAGHGEATSGNGSVITSGGRRFVFQATASGASAVALELKFSNTTAEAASSTIPDLHTTLAMQPGEYVVLAEAPPAAGAVQNKSATLMNLLVARVERLSLAAR